jgi:hypothetical protein
MINQMQEWGLNHVQRMVGTRKWLEIVGISNLPPLNAKKGKDKTISNKHLLKEGNQTWYIFSISVNGGTRRQTEKERGIFN